MAGFVFKALPLIILGLILSSFFGCRPEPLAPEEPRILILQPSAESSVKGPDVKIKAYVDYFNLVDKVSQPPVAGEGHIVYYMDSAAPIKSGQSALTEQGTCVATSQTEYVWQNVTPGRHVFTVQLVTNDNMPLEPASAVRVPITVK